MPMIVLQGNEGGPGDVTGHQLTNDGDGQEISGTSELLSGKDSESHENVTAAEEMASCDQVCDKTLTVEDDDATDIHRLDETVTDFASEKISAEDSTTASSDNAVTVEAENGDLSGSEGRFEINEVDGVVDNDLLVRENELQPASGTDSSSGVDQRPTADEQIDNVSEMASEYKDDRSGAVQGSSELLEEAVNVNTEVENSAVCGDGEVDNDVPSNSTSTVPSSAVQGSSELLEAVHVNTEVENSAVCGDSQVDNDVRSDSTSTPSAVDSSVTGDANIVDGSTVRGSTQAFSPLDESDQSHATPELLVAEAKSPPDGLPECRPKDADGLIKVGRELGGGDSVDAREDVTSNGDATQSICVDDGGDVRRVCHETEDLVSAAGNDVAVTASESQPSDDAQTKAKPQCIDDSGDDKSDIGLATVDNEAIESDIPQSASAVVSAETMTEDVNQPAADRAEHVDVSSSTGDDMATAKSDSLPSVCAEDGAETTTEHVDDVDKVQPAGDETAHAESAAAADTDIDLNSRPSDAFDVTSETTSVSEPIDVIITPPTPSDISSSAGDNIAVTESNSMQSVSVDESPDDGRDAADDSVVETDAETDKTETCIVGDRSDNADDVKAGDERADIAKEQEPDGITPTPVVDCGSISSAATVETTPETVAAVATSIVEDGENVGRASPGEDSSEVNAVVAEKTDTVVSTHDSGTVHIDTEVHDPGKPVAGEGDSQQMKADVDRGTEKPRLYAKNVVKSETPATGPVACLTAGASDTGKAGTLPQVVVTGDESGESQPVVMRKKSPADMKSAEDKENEASRGNRVRSLVLLL